MAKPRTSRRASNSAESAFLAELDAPAKSFLKEEEKGQLADEAIPFRVVAVDFTPSKQYGDRWELTIEAADGKFPFDYPADTRIILTMPSHGARDYIMHKLNTAVLANPVGPLVLTVTEIEDDRTWLALKRAPSQA